MKTVLTADVLAHGIVAAARVMDMDPLKAALVQRGRTKQVMTITAVALIRALDGGYARASAVLGVSRVSITALERDATRLQEQAIREARRAMVARMAGPEISAEARRVAAPPSNPASDSSPPRVDHTPAIRAALAKRKAVAFEVVGVERDALLLPEPGKGGCGFPMGDPRSPNYRACDAEKVPGRRYCAEHLRASGLKAEPIEIPTVGRMAAPYEGDAA